MRANKEMLLSIANASGLSTRVVEQYYCLYEGSERALDNLLKLPNDVIIRNLRCMKEAPIYRSYRRILRMCKPVEGTSPEEESHFRMALRLGKVSKLSEENRKRALMIITYLRKTR